jgi:hypothetical protein
MFNEEKTSHAAAYLLKLAGGRMAAGKLMRLLYLADREYYRTREYPITGDIAVSTSRGPALLATLALMDGAGRSACWDRLMSPVMGDAIALVADVGPDVGSDAQGRPSELAELCRGNITTLDEVFAKHGQIGAWDESDAMREFPEWEGTKSEGRPISIQAILAAVGKAPENIPAILDNLHVRDAHDRAVAPLAYDTYDAERFSHETCSTPVHA